MTNASGSPTKIIWAVYSNISAHSIVSGTYSITAILSGTTLNFSNPYSNTNLLGIYV